MYWHLRDKTVLKEMLRTNLKWFALFQLLETYLKSLITVGRRRSFICERNSTLGLKFCYWCHRFRYMVKYRTLHAPNPVLVARKGRWFRVGEG